MAWRLWIWLCLYVSNSIWKDKHQRRQSRIYDTAGVALLNPHRMTPFLLRPNNSAQLLKFIVAMANLTVSPLSSGADWHLDKSKRSRSDVHQWTNPGGYKCRLTTFPTRFAHGVYFFDVVIALLWCNCCTMRNTTDKRRCPFRWSLTHSECNLLRNRRQIASKLVDACVPAQVCAVAAEHEQVILATSLKHVVARSTTTQCVDAAQTCNTDITGGEFWRRLSLT